MFSNFFKENSQMEGEEEENEESMDQIRHDMNMEEAEFNSILNGTHPYSHVPHLILLHPDIEDCGDTCPMIFNIMKQLKDKYHYLVEIKSISADFIKRFFEFVLNLKLDFPCSM
jgi:hypothetical protein